MNYLEILEHFGSINKMAAALGVTRQACQCWRKNSRVPYDKQLIIEKISHGLLKAQKDITKARRAKKKLSIAIEDKLHD